MANNFTIFILFSCNEWKEYSSMRLIATSTNVKEIYKAIKSAIRKGDMNYGGLTGSAGVNLFKEDSSNNCIDLDLL